MPAGCSLCTCIPAVDSVWRARSDNSWVSIASCALVALVAVAMPGTGRTDDAEPSGRVTADAAETRDSRPEPGLLVVTSDEMERRGWRTVLDVLQHQPGLHVSQRGGIGQAGRVFARGQDAGGVLLRLDGVAITETGIRDPGTVLPDLLTVDIDRIEIRRGPRGVEYGSDATGGVIDVYTRRGEGRATPWARTEAGSYGTVQSSLGLAGAGGPLGYAFSYTNLRSRGVSAARKDFFGSERDGFENESISGRLDLAVGESLSLSLSGRLIDTQLDEDSNDFDVLRLAVLPDSRQDGGLDRRAARLDSRRLLLRGEAALELLDGRWIQRFEVGFVDHDLARSEPSANALSVVDLLTGAAVVFESGRFLGEGADSSRVTLAWRNELRLSGTNTLAIGLETERESSSRSTLLARESTVFALPVAPIPVPGPVVTRPIVRRGDTTLPRAVRAVRATVMHEHARSFAVYARDRFALGPVTAELGARLTDRDQTGSRLGYRVALEYAEPTTGARLLASVATGSRDPELAAVGDVAQATTPTSGPQLELGGSLLLLPGLLRGTTGDRSLEPTIVRGLELGAELPLPAGVGQVTLTVFASRTRGALGIEVAPLPTGQIALRAQDRVEERARGVEAYGELALSPWADLSFAYTYSEAEVRHSPSQLSFLFGGEDLGGIPKHLGDLRLAIRPADGLELVAAARYVGARKPELSGGFGSKLGGFTTFDFAASYDVSESIRVFARLVNAFDKAYHDPVQSNAFERFGSLGIELRY